MNAGEVKAKARELGFTHVGITPAVPLEREADMLREWIARGYAASMDWIGRSMEKRIDPGNVLPGARSVIAVAVNYYTGHDHPDHPETGKISRYAWGDDYHEILSKKLNLLLQWLQEKSPEAQGLIYVDTGPVMEKAWAERAGLGWLGKHANIITPDRGSWVFLGELLTTLELETDLPATDHCGTCTLCIQACPTEAIVEPYVVDSTRCLSYLTIEHRGEIAPTFRSHFEGWIYGCDICQDVCPWNHKFASESAEPGFQPREYTRAPDLRAWSALTAATFATLFRGSPVKRAKLEGLLRNVRIVLDARQGGEPDPCGSAAASH